MRECIRVLCSRITAEDRLASNCFDALANAELIASSHTERRTHSTAVQSTESTLLLESRFVYT